MKNKVEVYPFHHKETGTITYVVSEKPSNRCIIIDSILDFTQGKIASDSFDRIALFIKEKSLEVEWILDTHVHADHLTAAFYGRIFFQCESGISENYKMMQKKYALNGEFVSGDNYSRYFKARDQINFGDTTIQIINIFGHTITCLAYIIADNIFCGDLLLMPDKGCGRCDMDGGDPSLMYDSVQKIFSFPGTFKIYTCHDYLAANSEYRFLSTINEQRAENIYFKECNKETFVDLRKKRDSLLPLPRLQKVALRYNLFKDLKIY